MRTLINRLRRPRHVLLLYGLTFALSSGAACGADRTESPGPEKLAQLKARFQAGLDQIVEKYELPGMTAAYALPDGAVEAFASGVADRESGAKMTPRTPMLAGSVGKTFAAATALGLIHEGRLGLDDKIEKWLGQEPWFDRLPGGSQITVRHLLMHRGGVADHVYVPQFAVGVHQMMARLDQQPDAYYKPTELVEFILDRKGLFEPGQGYAYTDTGYILLGLVIERAARAKYYDEARERFLEPLELRDTVPADRRELPGLAAGYVAKDNPFGLPEKMTVADGVMCYNPAVEWTGGGLVSTSADLVRWGKALFEGRALKEPYVEQLVAPAPGDQDKKQWYGLGVSVSQGELGTSYGHGGWTPGYLTHLAYYPAQRVAIAVQVNSDTRRDMLADVMELVRDVLNTVGNAP